MHGRRSFNAISSFNYKANSQQIMSARIGIYKLRAGASKYKLRAEIGNYKLVPGQVQTN